MRAVNVSGQNERPASLTESDNIAERAPRYMYIITFLTIVYLIVELSFNARLLDVTGSDAPRNVVHATEYWGRGISGVAATLAVWGIWLMPFAKRRGWPLSKTLPLMVLVAAFCGIGMWQLQSSIIDHFVNQSTGDDRRIAAKLRIIERSAIRRRVEISGVPLTGDVINSPEGKSFLSLLPFMANSIDGVEQKIDVGLGDAIRSQVPDQIGDPATFYKTTFSKSVRAIEAMYNRYVDACNAYADATDPSIAWATYKQKLQEAGYTPDNTTVAGHAAAFQLARAMGAQVSENWSPDDMNTFSASYLRNARPIAQTKYASATTAAFGQSIPQGLSFDQFERLPVVQKRWHEILDLPTTTMLSYKLTDAPFLQAVYDPVVAAVAEQQVKNLNAPGRDYGDGGEKETEGRDAIAALIVPPIALAFSIAGALLHIFKSMNYVGHLCVYQWNSRRAGNQRSKTLRHGVFTPAIACFVVCLALTAFLFPNEVTNSPLYGFFNDHVTQKYGTVAEWTCRWVIQAQPFFWPVNEFIRTHLLHSFTFG